MEWKCVEWRHGIKKSVEAGGDVWGGDVWVEDVYEKERHVGERWMEEYGAEMCEVEKVYGEMWY